MKKKLKYLMICFLISYAVEAQIDTLKVLKQIRSDYHNIQNQLANLRKDTIDKFRYPSKAELEESQTGGHHKFIIYINNVDTLLIKEFQGSDEGGAFDLRVTEVYYKNSSPFFYFDKSYGSSSSILIETRMYVFMNQIISKLSKEVTVRWNEIPDYDLLPLSSPEIPNNKSIINKFDIYRIVDMKIKLRSD